jgi:RNA polymerase sigma-70 factor (ECF subfamily)
MVGLGALRRGWDGVKGGERSLGVPTDEDLALRVQRGDAQGLTALVERHHGPLLGFVYRMTGGDRALAEDLVQEAFLRVMRAIGQYRYPRPFKPWLYAIALNLARDHYRRADTRHAAALSEEAWESQPADPPDDGLLADAEGRQVAAAVHALPPHQREALVLRYYQGLSLDEIAAALDIPVGTVKSRLSLGLKRLRETLEPEA